MHGKLTGVSLIHHLKSYDKGTLRMTKATDLGRESSKALRDGKRQKSREEKAGTDYSRGGVTKVRGIKTLERLRKKALGTSKGQDRMGLKEELRGSHSLRSLAKPALPGACPLSAQIGMP